MMSPPIPAVKNRVHQPSQQASRQMMEDMGCPPLLDYVPYVRTDEVYQMDPLAPLSRPSTHEAQQRGNAGKQNMVFNPLLLGVTILGKPILGVL